MPALLQRLDRLDLAVGQHLGDHLVDAGLPRDRLGGGLAIAAQHHDRAGRGASATATTVARFGAQRIGDRKRGGGLAVDRGEHHRVAPVTVHAAAVRIERGRVDARFAEQRLRADDDVMAIDVRGHASPGERDEVVDRVAAGFSRDAGRMRRSPSRADAPIVASTAATMPQDRLAIADDRACRPRRGRPSVSVPVLSKTTVSTPASRSSGSPPLISTPALAPRPLATITAVGTARPIAHGQAMIRTATAAVNAERERRLGRNDHPQREGRNRDRRRPPGRTPRRCDRRGAESAPAIPAPPSSA